MGNTVGNQHRWNQGAGKGPVSVVRRPAARTSPVNLLETQILRSHPRPTEIRNSGGVKWQSPKTYSDPNTC